MAVKQQTTKYYFEPYQLAELYKLYDESVKIQGYYELYLLWSFIHKCFPKLNFKTGVWGINTCTILAPFIYNKAEKLYEKQS